MKAIPEITVELIHIHGGLKGEIQEFRDSPISVGRLPELTLVFPPDEPGVSREHARIEREGNQFRLVALKDRFGTFLNGRQVREAFLKNGDVIEFGSGGPKVSFNMEFGRTLVEPESAFQIAHEATALREPSLPKSPSQSAPSPSANGHPQQVSVPSMDAPVPTSSAPLTIQYGPTIRTYRELPVLIGSHPHCDFVLQERGVMDRHAQIYFHQGDYYVKDLTGQGTVRLNGQALTTAARLKQYDELECTLYGPVFRFLGEGRLAEVESPQQDEPYVPSASKPNEAVCSAVNAPSGIISRMIKTFRD